jgi:putative toxin-antitoxin system antitoxin component (TIGR02293 family)
LDHLQVINDAWAGIQDRNRPIELVAAQQMSPATKVPWPVFRQAGTSSQSTACHRVLQAGDIACNPTVDAGDAIAVMPEIMWHNGNRGILMSAQIRRIAEWLGAEPKTDFELAQIVRRGLPLRTRAIFLAHGLTKDEFHLIVISLRTFRHRQERLKKGQDELLSPDESDKAVRAARVMALAERVFANREKALAWMRKAKKRFEGETPMQMLQTEAGARLVEQMLIQLDEGMFA